MSATGGVARMHLIDAEERFKLEMQERITDKCVEGAIYRSRMKGWQKLAKWEDHISPSHINSAIRSLPAWYLERVVGVKTDSSAAAERGKAAEHGICLYITGAVKDLDDAVRMAQKRFSTFILDTRGLNAFAREYEYLDAMIRAGVDTLAYLGRPDLKMVGGEFLQPEISAYLDEVAPRCIGKLDAPYWKKKIIVDIKTSAKAVRGLKSEWRRQGAFYAHACPEHEMWFCVITPKGAEMIQQTPDELESGLAELTRAAQQIQNLLNTYDDPIDLAKIIIPDFSSFTLNDPKLQDAARETWG